MAGSTNSPYLARKEIQLENLQEACGSRVFVKEGRISQLDEEGEITGYHEGAFIFRELVDVTGASMGYERILDQKVQRYPDRKAGDKYLTGGASTSGFTPIGFAASDLPHLSGKVVVVCGLADGYRIHEASGLPVVCGVGEPSLPKLARIAHGAANSFGSRAEVLVAADNDKAGIAAAMRSGFRWVVPTVHKDWSDIYQAEGAHAVRLDLANEQEPVPEAELQERLTALGINASLTKKATSGESNHWIEGPVDPGAKLRSIMVELGTRRGIEGADQYMALLVNAGAAESITSKRIEVSSLETQALVVSMLSDGLLATLPATEQELAESHARKVLDLAAGGVLDHIEVVVRSPVLMSPGIDDSGRAALRFNSAYDARLKDVLKGHGGYWDKEAREWVVPAASMAVMDEVLASALGHAAGRLVLLRPENEGGGSFITGSPDRAEEIRRMVLPLMELAWEVRQEDAPAPLTPAGDPITFSIADKKGWPALSIGLPFHAREAREELKAMGAKFNGAQKVWELALYDEVLDKLERWGAETAGASILEIRKALEVCGFGYLEAAGTDGTLTVSAPYRATLVERLKEGLPKLARRFDPDSKKWQVDVGSVAVAHELYAIAAEFDLRLLGPDGEPLPRQAGWESMLAGGRYNESRRGTADVDASRTARANPPRVTASAPGL